MIHIPDDIYEQIADYVRENGDIERENRNYADHYCSLSGVQFESSSVEGLIVEVDGWVTVYFYKSREMWGIEWCVRGASSSLSCKTWDEDGSVVVANDFDENILHDSFQN